VTKLSEPRPGEDHPPLHDGRLWRAVARLIAGLSVAVVILAGVAHFFRSQLEWVARGFVDNLGYVGMGVGTWLADGFHFPVPPQFYMLIAVSSGASLGISFAVISVASLLGGFCGYRFAAQLSKISWLDRRLRGAQHLAHGAFSRFGYKAAIGASVLPIAYSVVCYLAGLNRLPRGFFIVLALCRIPRLVLFYLLVYWGWHGFG
jgi:membrane protein YqaA with SNARE-associated domain